MNTRKLKTLITLLIMGLLVSACFPTQPESPFGEADPGGENPLSGTQWQLSGYGTPEDLKPALADGLPTLSIGTGDLSGSTGCNHYGAEYTIREDTISLTMLIKTEVECLGPGLMEQEARFLAILGAVQTYTLVDETLTLSAPEGLLRFEPVVSPTEKPLVRRLWRLEILGTQQGTESVAQRIDERTLITAWFEDRKIGGRTGCNNYSVPYEAAGEQLTLTGEFVMTAAGCSDEESARLEQRFVEALQAAEAYHITDGRLTITFPGGELVFAAQEEPLGDENAVYSAIFREWDGGKGTYVILDQTQFNQPGATMEATLDFVRRQLPQPVAEDPFTLDPTTLVDFEEKNTPTHALREAVHMVYPTAFITGDEAGELLPSPDEDDWETFQKTYPDAQGIFSLSRVGFNDTGDQALVYMGLHSEEFTGGYYFLLVERDGLWSSTIGFMIWGPN